MFAVLTILALIATFALTTYAHHKFNTDGQAYLEARAAYRQDLIDNPSWTHTLES